MTEPVGRLISPPTLTQQNAPKYYPLKSVQIKNKDISRVSSKEKMTSSK